MMVYHDLPLGWLTLCKPASMQITLRINTSEDVLRFDSLGSLQVHLGGLQVHL